MIAIYILCGIGIGFSLAMMAAAISVEHLMQKRLKSIQEEGEKEVSEGMKNEF